MSLQKSRVLYSNVSVMYGRPQRYMSGNAVDYDRRRSSVRNLTALMTGSLQGLPVTFMTRYAGTTSKMESHLETRKKISNHRRGIELCALTIAIMFSGVDTLYNLSKNARLLCLSVVTKLTDNISSISSHRGSPKEQQQQQKSDLQ